jgi:hypothetical protein
MLVLLILDAENVQYLPSNGLSWHNLRSSHLSGLSGAASQWTKGFTNHWTKDGVRWRVSIDE